MMTIECCAFCWYRDSEEQFDGFDFCRLWRWYLTSDTHACPCYAEKGKNGALAHAGAILLDSH